MAEKPQRMADLESTTMDLEGQQSHTEKLGLASRGSAEGSDVPLPVFRKCPCLLHGEWLDRARVSTAVWERVKEGLDWGVAEGVERRWA